MDDQHDLRDQDAQLKDLLATLFPEEVLRHYKPEEVLRCHGLPELLRHLGELTPAERDEAELGLSPEVREALREHVGATPAQSNAVGPGPDRPREPLVHTGLSEVRGLEGFHDVVELMLSQFSPEAVLRGCNPADVLRYYPFSRLLCHLGNLTRAERASVEAGVPSALLEVLHTCKLDREMMRRLDARQVRTSTVERARGRLRRDELVDELLSVLSPAEVLRRYSVDQLVSHLCERAKAEGTLPDATIAALREYMEGTL